MENLTSQNHLLNDHALLADPYGQLCIPSARTGACFRAPCPNPLLVCSHITIVLFLLLHVHNKHWYLEVIEAVAQQMKSVYSFFFSFLLIFKTYVLFTYFGCAGSLLLCSVQFSHSVMSDSLRYHGLQHTRPPCPLPTRRVFLNSRPSSPWCHPAISSSVVPLSSCPQSLPASGSFPMSQLFAWGGQSTGVSALASFLPKKSQGWSLGWAGWISLLSKGLSRVFSNTTVQKHQFFSAHLSL